ncbi:hypothetical protein [Ferrimonas balearica]|uniref:hypothetical protein n=1 Tax=Ferrimonas balearica TaxID=44012 RepID=UPI001F375BDA|nr:hypothetical protein [Ferrimonas balearica]MBY6093834.1 hypothetical protein [Ferrimonas balearica]
MAVNKTKQLRKRDDLLGSDAEPFYFKFMKATCQETLEIMADACERDAPKMSEAICIAFEIRLQEIGGREY